MTTRLMDADTAEYIRPATADEIAASDAAAERDGGSGIFTTVDGRKAYTEV